MTDPAASRRPWYARPLPWVVTAVVVVLLAVAAFALPAIYARSQNAGAPESFDSAEPAEAAGESSGTTGTGGPPAGAADLVGAWRVSEGSQAGYRVDEVLNGNDVTVVGRTSKVTGEMTVEDGGPALAKGTVTVDLASVKTDSERRDGYFSSRAIDTKAHPQASFTLGEPVDLGRALAGATGDSIELELPGELEINGQKKPLTAKARAGIDGGGLSLTGSVPVTWADFDVAAPSLGFVKVEDSGTVEFSLKLAKG